MSDDPRDPTSIPPPYGTPEPQPAPAPRQSTVSRLKNIVRRKLDGVLQRLNRSRPSTDARTEAGYDIRSPEGRHRLEEMSRPAREPEPGSPEARRRRKFEDKLQYPSTDDIGPGPWDVPRQAGRSALGLISKYAKPLVYTVGLVGAAGIVILGLKGLNFGNYKRTVAKDLGSASKSEGEVRGWFSLKQKYDRIEYGNPETDSLREHWDPNCHIVYDSPTKDSQGRTISPGGPRQVCNPRMVEDPTGNGVRSFEIIVNPGSPEEVVLVKTTGHRGMQYSGGEQLLEGWNTNGISPECPKGDRMPFVATLTFEQPQGIWGNARKRNYATDVTLHGVLTNDCAAVWEDRWGFGPEDTDEHGKPTKPQAEARPRTSLRRSEVGGVEKTPTELSGLSAAGYIRPPGPSPKVPTTAQVPIPAAFGGHSL